MPRSRTAQRICQHGVNLEICSVCRPLTPQTHTTLNANLNALLEEARPRLLRLARLNGIAADMADDVVQETCVEAWRHLQKLREPERFASWLDGICRNVCRRQASALARNTLEVPLGSFEDEAGMAGCDLLDPLALDPNEELERQDRHVLLDRALGHLSERARELIELCYLAEVPQREVAQRLDMSLGALELKLHRARCHLRQVLNGALHEDAEAFGLLVNEDEAMGWQQTRQWCWLCGKQRLRGTFERRPSGVVALRLRCPDCSARYDMDMSGSGDIISLAGLRSFLPAMKRAVRASCDYFAHALHNRYCGMCQSQIQLRIVNRHAPGDPPVSYTLLPQRSFLSVDCPQCGRYMTDLVSVLLVDPAARSFALDRPRVIWEPDILAPYAGQDAICSRMVDLNTSDQLTIMAHPETLQVMATLLN
jgi:RNA polymerase sigma factor (sigma-70 family)